MSKFTKYLIITMITLGAATTVVADDYKIGVVNSLQVMEKSPQAAAMKARLQKEFAPIDRQLVVMQKKLKESEDRLTKDSAIMSESERSKLERDIIGQRRELKRKQDQFKEDLNFRQNEEVSQIQKEIIKAVQTVAKQHNYDIVLSDGVIHASPKVNITQMVIDYLNTHAKSDSGSSSGK